jgi:hypothetical protein
MEHKSANVSVEALTYERQDEALMGTLKEIKMSKEWHMSFF